MLNQNYIAKLLNLEDAIIKNVENKGSVSIVGVGKREPIPKPQVIFSSIPA